MATREWNATAYDALPLPHVEWGKRTIGRLAPQPGERIVDAGCGTGRDAAELLRQQPEAEVIGVDGSSKMIEQAAERIGANNCYVGDLTSLDDVRHATTLGATGEFDAVMSVACFHWITDHRALFSNFAAILKPGGRLVSDSGGVGNISNVEDAIANVEGAVSIKKGFVTTDETRQNLKASGFEPRSVELRPDPLRLDDPEVLERYLATVCLGSHIKDMSEADGAAFTHEVARAMREPVLDYVRLEIDALRL